MNWIERLRTSGQLKSVRLQAELDRALVVQKLEAKRNAMIEAWGSHDADYELGWANAIKSGLQPADNKTPINLSFVTDTMQAQSRELYMKNPFMQSAIFNLQHYVIGRGYQYRKTGATPEQSVALSTYWTYWRIVFDWFLMENEILKRALRDGEVIIQWFNDVPRFVEPKQLVSSREAPWGIFTDPKDSVKILAYNIGQLRDDGSVDATTAKKVPAEQVTYKKWPLVDQNCIRGLPPFYFYADNLNGALRCLRNMRELTAVQTAIALIREHPEGITGSKIAGWQERDADKQVTDPDTDKTVFQRKFQPGTMLETRNGEKLHFPGASINAASFIEVVSADLRAVAAGLALPEFIFTADAGRSNYASLMAAEGPAVKTFEAVQEWLGLILQECFQRVMTVACAGGNKDVLKRFPACQALDSSMLDLPNSVTGPSVRTRDFFAEARTKLIESQSGILSPQQWCANSGRDYDETMTQIDAHVAAHPNIPWPPSPPKQAGQAAEEFPPAPEPNAPDPKTQTGSQKRDAGKSGA